MPKITKLETALPAPKKRIRVAAYARVSFDNERLRHSVSAQISRYSEMIQKNPEWEYAGVYSDFAVTGTKTEVREGFQKLLKDCEDGRIDIILTKSISRFARNTVDLLETVRHLKEIGVEVRFEKERINTLTEGGELLLTLLASFAQEESRSLSENSKWGIRKRYANGTIGLKNHRVYGYISDGENLVVVPEEAEFVRLMFGRIIEGRGLADIVRELKEKGARTWQGNEFGYQQVDKIITNELYIGDRKLQKTFIEDPISKKKVKNEGQLPQYYITDDHPAIVDKETFEKANEILKEWKRYRREEILPKYPFSSKIICGKCGSHFNRRMSTPGKKNPERYATWYCAKKKNTGETCKSCVKKEKELEGICAGFLGMEKFDAEVFAERIRHLTVLENGDVEAAFYGGEKKLWRCPPRVVKKKEKKPVIIRPKRCMDGRIFCGQCGRRYGRQKSDRKDGGTIWRCRSKSSSEYSCESVNYYDEEIRKIYCRLLRCKTFDEADFDKTVEKVIVQKNGCLDFYLSGGRILHHETLKLFSNRYENTCTPEFEGRLVCGCCGNGYRRQGSERYSYWKCLGKHRVRTECKSAHYTDCNLRQISAWIMGLEEFDTVAFTEQIECITALENGGLEYTFRDGRKRRWQDGL